MDTLKVGCLQSNSDWCGEGTRYLLNENAAGHGERNLNAPCIIKPPEECEAGT
jgi:hypothetical protein